MKVIKTKTELVIKVPLKTKRFNPYMDEYVGEMDNIAGLIVHYEGWDEAGFAYLIDMDYKGKDDQVSDFFVKVTDNSKEFKKRCMKLGFDVYECDGIKKVSERIGGKDGE